MPPRSLSLVAAVLLIAVLAVNARIVFGDRTWADVRYHTEVVPPRLAAATTAHGGALPQWWDGDGLGVPLAAEPTHGAWYPPQWLPTTPRGLDLFTVLHLAWAALGVAVWARGLYPRREGTPGALRGDARGREPGCSEEAALVAGLLLATTGLLASAALRGALPGLAHLPWIGIAATCLADAGVTGRPRQAWLATAALGGLLGLVGLAGNGGAFIDALVIAVVVSGRQRLVGVALLGGLAIAAAQWVPAALLAIDGTIVGGRVPPLRIARLLELLVPGSFGAREGTGGIAAITGPLPWAPSLFVGATLLALAAVRLPTLRVRGALAILAGLVLLAGRGRSGSWSAWLGAPDVHLMALVLVLASNVGGGIDALLAGERRALRALGVGAACTGVALLALVLMRGRVPSAASVIERAMLDGSLALACMVAALMLAARRGPGVRGAALGRAAPIVLALLVLPNLGTMPSTAPLAARAIVDEPPPWARAILEHGTSPLDARHGGAPLRVFRPAYMYDAPLSDGMPAVDRDAKLGLAEATASLAGAGAARFGIVAARSDDPARARDEDESWYRSSGGGGVLLDRFGIEYAILPTTMIVPLKVPNLGTRDRWTLAAMPVAPIASVQRGALWSLDREDTLALLYPPGGHFGMLPGTVVLRGTGDSAPDAGPPLPCRVDAWRAGDITLGCTSPAPGYATISSAAAPGWQVTVDGTEQPWLVADLMRRAVAVGPGTHAIRWRYSAPGQLPGLLVALAGVLLLGGAVLRGRRYAAPPTRAPE